MEGTFLSANKIGVKGEDGKTVQRVASVRFRDRSGVAREILVDPKCVFVRDGNPVPYTEFKEGDRIQLSGQPPTYVKAL